MDSTFKGYTTTIQVFRGAPCLLLSHTDATTAIGSKLHKSTKHMLLRNQLWSYNYLLCLGNSGKEEDIRKSTVHSCIGAPVCFVHWMHVDRHKNEILGQKVRLMRFKRDAPARESIWNGLEHHSHLFLLLFHLKANCTDSLGWALKKKIGVTEIFGQHN